MGQDNLAKILLALFSFKRLKEKYDSYQGGILAIDELDATMYPASQVELLNILRKYSAELNLQIIFTTHSISLLKAVDELGQEAKKRSETSNQVRLVYLKRSDNNVHIKYDIDFKGIILDLNVVASTNNRVKNKITVYAEDKETQKLVKAILKSKANCLKFVDATLPCSTLIEMSYKGVPAFCYPYSLIILDGDVRKNKTYMKKIDRTKNILILPCNESPERLIASFLYNLSDDDHLWSELPDGYTKQFCFREINYSQITANGEIARKKAKEWFNNQYPYWGSKGNKVFNPYMKSIQRETEIFKSQFEEMIKHYIHD